jgi:hypothetical protein
MNELGFNDWLGENIHNMIFETTKLQVKNLIMKELSFVVHMDLNVFGVLVLNWIVSNVDGTLIVAPKSYWLILGITKLHEQLLNLNNFSANINCTSIIYLYRRKSNSMFLFVGQVTRPKARLKV